ncbi:hypothetical protein KKF04_00395 [Patescibacteria group bacterium]|nr:hypothetical protein [Patescibacteria group bacterium]
METYNKNYWLNIKENRLLNLKGAAPSPMPEVQGGEELDLRMEQLGKKVDEERDLYALRDMDNWAKEDRPAVSQETMELARAPEFMDQNETYVMRDSQEVIFRHWLNPSFILHITRGPLKNEKTNVDNAMRIAMRHPHDLWYREMERSHDGGLRPLSAGRQAMMEREQIIEVIKRPNSTNPQVPDGFKMIIEGGYITEITTYDHDAGRYADIDLIGRDQDIDRPIPWKSTDEAVEGVPGDATRIANAMRSTISSAPDSVDTTEEIYQYQLENMSAELREKYIMVMITMGWRILDLIGFDGAYLNPDPPGGTASYRHESERNRIPALTYNLDPPDISNEDYYQTFVSGLRNQPIDYARFRYPDRMPRIRIGAAKEKVYFNGGLSSADINLYHAFEIGGAYGGYLFSVTEEGYVVTLEDNPATMEEDYVFFMADSYQYVDVSGRGAGANRLRFRYYEEHPEALKPELLRHRVANDDDWKTMEGTMRVWKGINDAINSGLYAGGELTDYQYDLTEVNNYMQRRDKALLKLRQYDPDPSANWVTEPGINAVIADINTAIATATASSLDTTQLEADKRAVEEYLTFFRGL